MTRGRHIPLTLRVTPAARAAGRAPGRGARAGILAVGPPSGRGSATVTRAPVARARDAALDGQGARVS